MTVYSRVSAAPATTSRRVRVGGTAATAAAVWRNTGGSAQRVDTAASPPPSTPTFVGATGNKGFAATTAVPALPAVQAGDVLLALAGGNDQTATLTPPAGLAWSVIADTGTGSQVRARLLVAVATDTLPAGTWTWGGSHNHTVQIAAWRNVATPSAAAATLSAAGQATVNAPTRTTTAAGALLVCLGFHTTAGDTSRGFPGSMAPRRDGGNGAASSVIAEETRPTPGTTGTRAYTIAPGSAVLAALSVVLEPK